MNISRTQIQGKYDSLALIGQALREHALIDPYSETLTTSDADEALTPHGFAETLILEASTARDDDGNEQTVYLLAAGGPRVTLTHTPALNAYALHATANGEPAETITLTANTDAAAGARVLAGA